MSNYNKDELSLFTIWGTKLAGRDITSLIERLEAFEDRLGVRLEGLFASLDEDIEWIDLNGEIHPQAGTELQEDVELIATVYDSDGRVIETSAAFFDTESFFGFEVFSLSLNVGDIQPAKVRIYPKNRG